MDRPCSLYTTSKRQKPRTSPDDKHVSYNRHSKLQFYEQILSTQITQLQLGFPKLKCTYCLNINKSKLWHHCNIAKSTLQSGVVVHHNATSMSLYKWAVVHWKNILWHHSTLYKQKLTMFNHTVILGYCNPNNKPMANTLPTAQRRNWRTLYHLLKEEIGEQCTNCSVLRWHQVKALANYWVHIV